MVKLKSNLPILVAVVGVVLLALAIFVGTQMQIGSESRSASDVLDMDQSSSTPPPSGDDLNREGSNTAAGVPGAKNLEGEEDESFNWQDVLDGAQWRYFPEEGIEMRLVFHDYGFTRTQAMPPDTSTTRTGQWVVLCPTRERGWRVWCTGKPGDTVGVRLEIGAADAPHVAEEVLHLTYIDKNTFEGRYDSMPADETFQLTKVIR